MAQPLSHTGWTWPLLMCWEEKPARTETLKPHIACWNAFAQTRAQTQRCLPVTYHLSVSRLCFLIRGGILDTCHILLLVNSTSSLSIHEVTSQEIFQKLKCKGKMLFKGKCSIRENWKKSNINLYQGISTISLLHIVIGTNVPSALWNPDRWTLRWLKRDKSRCIYAFYKRTPHFTEDCLQEFFFSFSFLQNSSFSECLKCDLIYTPQLILF